MQIKLSAGGLVHFSCLNVLLTWAKTPSGVFLRLVSIMSQQRSEHATTEACSDPATAPPGGDLMAGHQRPDLWGNLQRQPARTHRPRGVSSESPAGTTVRSEFETDETETGEDQSVIEGRFFFFCLTGGRRRAFQERSFFFLFF